MTYGTYDDFARPSSGRRTSRRLVSHIGPAAAALTLVGAVFGTWLQYGEPHIAPPAPRAAMPSASAKVTTPTTAVAPAAALAATDTYLARLEPAHPLASSPLGAGGPPASAHDWFETRPTVSSSMSAAPIEAAPPAQTATADPETVVPLPVPRPREFRAPAVDVETRATRQAAPVAAPPVAQPDNRSFFEKMFGGSQPASTGTALAYAAPEAPVVRGSLPRVAPGRAPVAARATAIYDISARTVYMPDGSRLEAHSGFGDGLDNLDRVTERMTGPTPPATYSLTEREGLFHGVRALRLTPVGGGDTFGRTGLLAHRFMMGPRGDSNGCVSFRDYDAFLQAYLRGEVKRLVVVARM